MKFLLTNDDGIDAPGLEMLRSVVAELGEPIVVAPDRHLSGCAHRVVTDEELNLDDRGNGRFALDGTPADCVRVGLLHVCPDVKWVLSGVNDGGNLGVDTFLSGTVAGAREAALFGRPSIAFSQYRRGKAANRWEPIQCHLRRTLEMLLEEPPGVGAIWNVNFPAVDDLREETRAIRCPLEPGHLPVRYEVVENRFRYRGVYADRPRRPGSDVDACFSGHIAVTRLRLF